MRDRRDSRNPPDILLPHTIIPNDCPGTRNKHTFSRWRSKEWTTLGRSFSNKKRMLLEQRAKLRQEGRDYQKACSSRSVTSTPSLLSYTLTVPPLIAVGEQLVQWTFRSGSTQCSQHSLTICFFQDVGTATPLHKSHHLSSGTVWLAWLAHALQERLVLLRVPSTRAI